MIRLLRPELHDQHRDLYDKAADQWRKFVGSSAVSGAGAIYTIAGLEGHSTPVTALGGSIMGLGLLATDKIVGQLRRTSSEFAARLEVTATS